MAVTECDANGKVRNESGKRIANALDRMEASIRGVHGKRLAGDDLIADNGKSAQVVLV